MTNVKTISQFAIAMALWLLAATAVAQPVSEVRLMDLSTNLPIVEATFEYGDQKGLSDKEGLIFIQYNEGNSMKLSHVAYGKWVLSDTELKAAIADGFIYKESYSLSLFPVTVIAMRSNSGQKENLDFDYKDRMAHDGGTLLNQIPAIASIRKGGNYGFDPVLRGFKYDQLNIVMNGVQGCTAACPNRMDPPTSQMAPNMMDRVEILKGPHALRYGVGFGGTINFIPEALRFTDESDIYGRLSGEYESQGNVFSTEGLIGFNGQSYDIGIFGAWSQGNDYKDGDHNAVPADFMRGSFGANLGFRISGNHQLRFSANRNLARDADFPALPMDLRMDDTWMVSARHDVSIDKGSLISWSTAVYGSFVDHRMDNLLKNLDPRMMNAKTLAKTRNFGGRTEGAWDFGRTNLYFGGDVRTEGAEGIRTREFLMGPMAGNIVNDNAWQNGQITKSALFAEFHVRKNSLQVILSSRLEVNASNANDIQEDFSEVYPDAKEIQFNPSLSVGLVNRFEKDVTLGFWLARAMRSGSMTERFINYFPVGEDPYEMLGNPMLDPEANHQVDMTFEWKGKKTAINVDVFFAYLNDYITSAIDESLTPTMPTSPGVRRYVNSDHVIQTGFEVTFAQDLFVGLDFHLAAAYTYGQDLVRDEALPEIAPFDVRYALSGRYLDDRLRPSFSVRHVVKQNRISEEYGETPSPRFTLLDIELAYQFHKIFGMSAGVQNLLDITYYEHLNRSVRGTPDAINAPGRNFFVSFSLNFMD